MRLRVGWPAFVLAAVVALGVAAGVGWTRYVALEGPVGATATPGAPAQARGLRITAGAATSMASVPMTEGDPLVAPAGSIWVRLTFEVTVTAPVADPLVRSCIGYLESGGDRWADSYDVATAAGHDYTERDCGTGSGPALPVGATKTVTKHWLVPAAAAVAPRFYLRFPSPAEVVELKPGG